MNQSGPVLVASEFEAQTLSSETQRLRKEIEALEERLAHRRALHRALQIILNRGKLGRSPGVTRQPLR
jgi:AmiR/NasT family two-component response regulator